MSNQVTIKMVEARDLKAADFGGTSDPYAELRVVSMTPSHTTVQKTRVINKTLCPTWNESFTFPIQNPREDSVEIKIYDHDAVGNNDLLGSCLFAVAACMGRPSVDEWRDLRDPKNKQVKGRGQIHIIATYTGQGAYVAPAPTAPMGAPAGYPGAYPPPQQGMAYPPPGQPGMGYPPPGQPGYPPQGMPPPPQQQYAPPPQGMPGYPPQQPPMGGMPPPGAYPPQPMPGYPPQPMGAPVMMGAPPPMMGAPVMMGAPPPMMGAPVMGAPVMMGAPMMGGMGGAPPGFYYSKKGKLKPIKMGGKKAYKHHH